MYDTNEENNDSLIIGPGAGDEQDEYVLVDDDDDEDGGNNDDDDDDDDEDKTRSDDEISSSRDDETSVRCFLTSTSASDSESLRCLRIRRNSVSRHDGCHASYRRFVSGSTEYIDWMKGWQRSDAGIIAPLLDLPDNVTTR
jgi:hypothetical protein